MSDSRPVIGAEMIRNLLAVEKPVETERNRGDGHQRAGGTAKSRDDTGRHQAGEGDAEERHRQENTGGKHANENEQRGKRGAANPSSERREQRQRAKAADRE